MAAIPQILITPGGGAVNLDSPPPIGDITPNTGAFTTLSVTTLATMPDGGTLDATGLKEPQNIALGVSLPPSLFGGGNLALLGTSCLWGFNVAGFHGAAFAVNECPQAPSGATALIDTSMAGWTFNLQVGVNDGFFVNRIPAGGAPSSFVNMLSIDAHGQVLLSPGFLVAALPAGILGSRAFVTDAVGPTFLGTLTGGGTVKCPVFFNGAAWVAG